MAFTKVYIGDTEDLKLLDGDDIIGFTFTVTNADNTPYDFTGFTDQNLFIFTDKFRNTLVKTITAAQLAIASNIITWTSDYSADIALEIGNYYYTLTYEDATSRPITIVVGDLKVV